MKGVTRDYAQLLGFACQSIGIAVLLGITFLRLGEVCHDCYTGITHINNTFLDVDTFRYSVIKGGRIS
jgi:hypothetical protein